MHVWVEQALTQEAVLNGVVGCTWVGTAWWSRERIAALRYTPWNIPPPAVGAPRGQHQAHGTVPHQVVHQTTIVDPAAAFHAPLTDGEGRAHLVLGHPHWPLRISYATIALLSGAGTLLFAALLYNLPVPQWNRAAFILQVLAGGLAALLLLRWPLSVRTVLYPLVLAVLIYLWDTTLPPPTLPGGVLRDALPRLVLIGLLLDGVLTLQQRRITRPYTVQIRAGILAIEDAAVLLGITVDAVRWRLQHAGRTARRLPDGAEVLSLDDLRAITQE